MKEMLLIKIKEYQVNFFDIPPLIINDAQFLNPHIFIDRIQKVDRNDLFEKIFVEMTQQEYEIFKEQFDWEK